MPRRRYPGLQNNEAPPSDMAADQAVFLRFELNADKVKPKEAKLDGVDYLVVPTVLICEGVHNGLFYPSTELRKFPQAWNGRPIPIFHPTDLDGNSITANSPETIQQASVGQLFNVKWNSKSKKLQGEAWVSPVKCAALGENGQAVLNAIQTSTTMEVSTGLFVDVVDEPGTWNSETYEGVAINHRPDHFALLPSGVGACSVADGAGFPRLNVETDKLRALAAQVPALLATLKELSYNERQRLVRDALVKKFGSGSKEAPSYVYVEDVFDKEVIYSVEGSGKATLMSVGYSVNGKGEVSIGPDAAVAVRRVTSYEPVTNEQAHAKEGTDSMDPKTEAQPGAPVTPNGTPGAPAAPTKAHTIEELLGNADDALKANIEDALGAQKAVRDALVAKITANKANTFSSEELTAMTTDQLGKIATLATPPAAPATPPAGTPGEAPKTPEDGTKGPEGNAAPPATPSAPVTPSFAGNDAGPAPATTPQAPAANQEQADGSGVPLPPKMEFKRR